MEDIRKRKSPKSVYNVSKGKQQKNTSWGRRRIKGAGSTLEFVEDVKKTTSISMQKGKLISKKLIPIYVDADDYDNVIKELEIIQSQYPNMIIGGFQYDIFHGWIREKERPFEQVTRLGRECGLNEVSLEHMNGCGVTYHGGLSRNILHSNIKKKMLPAVVESTDVSQFLAALSEVVSKNKEKALIEELKKSKKRKLLIKKAIFHGKKDVSAGSAFRKKRDAQFSGLRKPDQGPSKPSDDSEKTKK